MEPLIVHLTCLQKLQVNTLSFSCNDLGRRLKPDGHEFMVAYKSVPLTRNICLICGQLLDDKFSDRSFYLSSKTVFDPDFISAQTIWCKTRCSHGVHLSCLSVHVFYQRLLPDGEHNSLNTLKRQNSFNALNDVIRDFSCDNIELHFDANKIYDFFHTLCRHIKADDRQTEKNFKHVKKNSDEHKAVLSSVQPFLPHKTRVRYHDNLGDYECDACEKLVPHEELHHELYNCTAIPSKLGFVCSRSDPIHMRRMALNKLTQIIIIKQSKTFSWDPGIRRTKTTTGTKDITWDPGK